MTDVPWILALAAAGLGGGILLARRRHPAVWLTWLSLPFLGLIAILAIEASLDASATHKGDKVAFGLVLYSLLIAPPWLGANLMGWLLGRRLWRGSRVEEPSPPECVTSAPAMEDDDGLPDWSRYDNPRVEPWALRARMGELARRGGLDQDALPHFDFPPGGSGECVIQDKFGYVYLGLKENRTLFEESSSNADRLCYEVLRRRAKDLVRRRRIEAGLDPGENPAGEREQTAAVLAAIDRRWATFFLRMPYAD